MTNTATATNLSENKIPVIQTCDIGKMPTNLSDPMPEITVLLSNGNSDSLGTYYPDELTFHPTDFIGKTMEEAQGIKRQRDVDYLRS